MRKHSVIDLELIRTLIQFSCNATDIWNWNSQSYAYSVYGIYTTTLNFFQTCFPDTRAPENFLLNLSSYHISKYPNQLLKSLCVSKAGLSRTTLEVYSRFSDKDFLDNLYFTKQFWALIWVFLHLFQREYSFTTNSAGWVDGWVRWFSEKIIPLRVQ